MDATRSQDKWIRKAPRPSGPAPNLPDYQRFCGAFDWQQARDELAGLPGGRGLNIAYEAVDRHVDEGHKDKIAIRWIAKDRSLRDISYGELGQLTNRFANALVELGIERGERVFSLLGRVPELFVTALGTWKRGAVYCPLFSAFGPEPVKARMQIAGATALVTTERLFRRKVAPILSELPTLRHVILVGGGPDHIDFDEMIGAASERFAYDETEPEELSTLHFTSGTTGKPKGAMHAHAAVAAHRMTARLALDLNPDDVYWCTADPGWVTGTSYGIIGPLAIGCTAIVDVEEFDAERWYGVLAGNTVNVWYTAPTAIRMLMRAGADLPRRFDLSSAALHRECR